MEDIVLRYGALHQRACETAGILYALLNSTSYDWIIDHLLTVNTWTAPVDSRVCTHTHTHTMLSAWPQTQGHCRERRRCWSWSTCTRPQCWCWLARGTSAPSVSTSAGKGTRASSLQAALWGSGCSYEQLRREDRRVTSDTQLSQQDCQRGVWCRHQNNFYWGVFAWWLTWSDVAPTDVHNPPCGCGRG